MSRRRWATSGTERIWCPRLAAALVDQVNDPPHIAVAVGLGQVLRLQHRDEVEARLPRARGHIAEGGVSGDAQSRRPALGRVDRAEDDAVEFGDVGEVDPQRAVVDAVEVAREGGRLDLGAGAEHLRVDPVEPVLEGELDRRLPQPRPGGTDARRERAEAVDGLAHLGTPCGGRIESSSCAASSPR